MKRFHTSFPLVLEMVLGVTIHAATLPGGFSEFDITGVNGVSSPTAMEFAPDGKLFVLEQAGMIEVYEGSGATEWARVTSNFLQPAGLSIDSTGERGLLGIAFDPNYMSNRFLYLYYTSAAAPIHNRISRFTANAAGTQVLAGSETVIMDLENLDATNHNGGAVHFGPDGKLYVAVGDNASSSNSQNINNRLGKMLRLNPDPANPIPSDNPTSIDGIAGTTTGLNRAVWAAGLRNPFTFTFKPGSSEMFINDVGAGAFEEINRGEPGVNFGWPITEGPFSLQSFREFSHPLVAYHHSNSALNYPPGGPSYTGNVITGAAFYQPNRYLLPCDFMGDYFYADAGGGWIRRYDPASNTVHNFATGAGAPVDLRIGPDGALYYLSIATGNVYRVVNSNPPSTGDTNCDGAVGIADLLQVIGTWGACPSPLTATCTGDVAPLPAGDRVVGIADLLAVIGNWG